MKHIAMILCLITFSFTEDFLYNFPTNDESSNDRNGFFERFYIYGSFYNYQSIRDKNKNLKENSAGVNLVKTIEIPFGNNNKVRVDGKAIFDNYETGSEEIFSFNELYFVAKLNDIEFDVGRKYSDFSVAKTYTLLDFISKPLTVMDSEDTEISKEGKDGISFGYTPSWLEGSEMFFYAYTDEFSNKTTKSEELLIELRLNNQFVKSRLYSFFNDQSESSLAGSIIANVNRDIDVYAETKYQNNENLDYILGVNYQAYKNFYVRIERAILNSSISPEEIFTKFDGDKAKLREYYDGGLSGKNYINIFVKYAFPEYPSSLYFSAVRNMGDQSTRVSTKVDYLQGRMKYYAQIIRNLGDEKSELYHKAHTKITFHVSLNLTDNPIEPLSMQ